jgi:winged helix DNA-binding protein
MSDVADELLGVRLANQHLSAPQLEDPAELVAHMGAVQAQDYPAALWGLGLRLRNATSARLQQAFADGKFLRTHVLRPTWHFVAPADIRWMLALTGPRIKSVIRSYTRFGLDDEVFARATAVIARAVEGGQSRTRAEVAAALRQAGFSVDGPLVSHMLGWAELEGVITSGPPRGRQHTYALLEERVPPAPALDRDEAVAELTWRYFNSHGPALVQDCGWWSGLTLSDIRRGLELNRCRLEAVSVDGRTYWTGPECSFSMQNSVHLLPNFDEYTVAYRFRDLYFDAELGRSRNPREDVPFRDVILARGRVAGRWKRATRESSWWIEPSGSMSQGLDAALARYAAFVSDSAK